MASPLTAAIRRDNLGRERISGHAACSSTSGRPRLARLASGVGIDLALLVTIALIFCGTSLVGYVRSRITDRCLLSFHGFQVTLRRDDGRQVWGRMLLSPGGIEFIYPEREARFRKRLEELPDDPTAAAGLGAIPLKRQDHAEAGRWLRTAYNGRETLPVGGRRVRMQLRELTRRLKDRTVNGTFATDCGPLTG